jgi:hypothetical protein
VGGGVQLGPLVTAATIVPAPGDYDDGEFGGMKIGKGNRSTRRKPNPAPLCPPQIQLDKDPGLNPGRRGGKPATNRLSYGAALICTLLGCCSLWCTLKIHQKRTLRNKVFNFIFHCVLSGINTVIKLCLDLYE